MKQLITFIVSFILLTGSSFAQNVPQGMKYQAVARDADGQVIAGQDITLRISLYDHPARPVIDYMETHQVTTNELGLFALTVGEGIPEKGTFDRIPWGTEEIWMQVSIRTTDQVDFVTISDTKMLSVPYAFHAGTANDFAGTTDSRGGTTDPYTKIWNVQGNYLTHPPRDKLGTADLAPLSVVTNNIERMNIADTGDISIVKSLAIGRNLDVENDVYLNTNFDQLLTTAGDPFNIGETINFGNFTVENESATHLTGNLTVDKNSLLKGNLVVEKNTLLKQELEVYQNSLLKGNLAVEMNTLLKQDLEVDQNSKLKGNLQVDGMMNVSNVTQSENTTNGALVVAGGVGIGKNLNVGGTTTLGDLQIKGNKPSFVASFENTNDGTGDGIVIKLGKTHPAWDGNDTLHVTSPASETVDAIAGTILQILRNGDLANLNPADFIQYYPPLVQIDLASSLFNTVTGAVNSGLGLPWTDRDLSVWLNGHDPVLCELKDMKANGGIDWEALEEPFSDWEPPYNTEEFKNQLLAKIDGYDCPDCWDDAVCNGLDGLFEDDELYYDDEWSVIIPEIPKIPMISGFLPEFSDMNIAFSNVNNSLTGENQFISFKDKEGRELGSIRAISVDEWVDNSLKDILVTMGSQAIGFDVVNGAFNVFAGLTEIADSYNALGVEYASGNGDYAEWLERLDPKEVINEGNIVGVIGGKITKDIRNAEQVLAVSARPIMLGNVPEKGKEASGNKVAFLGQIPVKIIGPVSSGDYIIGNPSTPGYGLAVHPDDMTPEQVRISVGRAWDTNRNDGPKMINTVIGVDNGGFLKLLQDNRSVIEVLSTNLDALNAHINKLESRLESFISGSEEYAEITPRQKNKKSVALK